MRCLDLERRRKGIEGVVWCSVVKIVRKRMFRDLGWGFCGV